MIRRNKKTRKYQAPDAQVTQMALESNFCATVRFNAQVDEMEHLYHHEEDGTADAEPLYFEF